MIVGLEGYIEELIAARRRSLTDDLISELIRAEDNGDRLSHDEIVNLAVILLNAGTDSTRNQLAAAVQTLADHPDQSERLAAHPELAPYAVEELTGHSPILFRALRKAVVDVELAVPPRFTRRYEPQTDSGAGPVGQRRAR